MGLQHEELIVRGIRISAREQDREVARAFLYLLNNNLHSKPFGFMEDVYVEKEFRGAGYGTMVIKDLLLQAQANECYKVVGTSRHERPRVHALYEGLGFRNQGLEFRIDL